MFKISISLSGLPAGKDQTAGFSSLLLLTGLSIAAGALIYSATNRSINMNSMLQTARYQSSRDAIANSIRYTVGIPALLKLSASQDSASHLFSCLDTAVTNQCDAKDIATGISIDHDLKVFDMQSKQLTGTAANPVYYDPQTGGLCGTTYSPGCDLQSTATFQISCGGAANCRGVSSAMLTINFRVELKSGATLPNNTTLNPFVLNPDIQIPLSAIQTGIILTSTSPTNNQTYVPVNDPTTETNMTSFTLASGSRVCNDLKALGKPIVNYDALPATTAPGTQYTLLNQDIQASDETINDISNINGNVSVSARTLTTASNITAGSNGVDLNVVDIGTLSNINAPHTSIVSHTVGSISNFVGHLYASADTIGSLSNIATNPTEYLVLANRGWIDTGSAGSTPISLSNITGGQFLLCGFSISDLSNVTASFIGITNASVVANSSNVHVGQLTIFGGTIGNLSNFTGNLTLYNTTVNTLSNISGDIQIHGGSISQISTWSSSGHLVATDGATISNIDNSNATIDFYTGAHLVNPPTNFTGTITYH